MGPSTKNQEECALQMLCRNECWDRTIGHQPHGLISMWLVFTETLEVYGGTKNGPRLNNTPSISMLYISGHSRSNDSPEIAHKAESLLPNQNSVTRKWTPKQTKVWLSPRDSSSASPPPFSKLWPWSPECKSELVLDYATD